MDVTHNAPTPADSKVEAGPKYIGRTGKGEKTYEFEVVATDQSGEIGRRGISGLLFMRGDWRKGR